MLTCVQAGFQFYSDDATLLRQRGDGQIEVVSLLGCINVTEKTLEWFPELAPHTSDATSRTGNGWNVSTTSSRSTWPRTASCKRSSHRKSRTKPMLVFAPISKMSLFGELLPFSLDLHDTNAAKKPP